MPSAAARRAAKKIENSGDVYFKYDPVSFMASVIDAELKAERDAAEKVARLADHSSKCKLNPSIKCICGLTEALEAYELAQKKS